jgi:hypothetical protein
MKEHWGEKGYTPATAREVVDGSIAGKLYTDDIRDHPVYARFLSDTSYDFFNEGNNSRILHFRKGLSFDGDLDMTVLTEIGIVNEGIIVEGDVDISGVFEAQLNMSVFGNVKAKSLFKEMSHVAIWGDLEVGQTVFGEYNDGSLKVSGDVRGELWVSNDHNMHSGGMLHMKSVYEFDEAARQGLNPELFYQEDHDDEETFVRFDSEKAIRFLRAGKSLLSSWIRHSSLVETVFCCAVLQCFVDAKRNYLYLLFPHDWRT